MNTQSKSKIYQGMIQYLLGTSHYSLKRIAALSNIPLKSIRAIYSYNELPIDLKKELNLIKLYQIALELEEKNTLQTH